MDEQYIEKFTPSDALRILQGNTQNRKLSPVRVARIADAINRNAWIYDANPIKVARSGKVLDGQHRLHAIATSGKSVAVLLVTNLSEDSQIVMDSGKSRTFEDYLTLKGIPQARNVAAAARLVWNYQHGFFTRTGSEHFNWVGPDHDQLWDLYEDKKLALEAGVNQAAPVTRKIKVSRSVMAGGYVILGEVECDRCSKVEEDLDEFYDQLAFRPSWDGRSTRFDSVQAFYDAMNNRRGPEASRALIGTYAQSVQLALLLKAWNFYREGRRVKLLKYTVGGKAPEKFPVPH